MATITLTTQVFDIKNIAYGGRQSDDTNVSDRQIAYWIQEVRALLLTQRLSKTRRINDAFIQHLDDIALEKVDVNTELTTGCEIYRSVEKVPTTLNRNGKNTILSVESSDGAVSFTETSYFRKKWNSFNKYSGSAKRWYLKDGYLYITNASVIENVRLSGVFDDPLAVFAFDDPDTKDHWDLPYPITGDMASMVTDLVLQTKMGITRSVPEDDKNDAQDTPATQAKR